MQPTYLLKDVQAQVALLGANAFSKKSLDLAQDDFDMTLPEIMNLIMNRSDTTCYKTMLSNLVDGAMQDVYRWPTPCGKTAYVKVSLHPGSKVVIQFKEK